MLNLIETLVSHRNVARAEPEVHTDRERTHRELAGGLTEDAQRSHPRLTVLHGPTRRHDQAMRQTPKRIAVMAAPRMTGHRHLDHLHPCFIKPGISRANGD